MFSRKVKFTLVPLLLCTVFNAGASAYGSPATKGRLRYEPAFFVGVAAKNIKIGKTTSGEDVTMSGGGGIGGTMCIGYSLTNTVDIDLAAGMQTSSLQPEVSNAEGSFRRAMVFLTGKYKIPARDNYLAKIGAGVSYYNPGTLTLELQSIGLGIWEITYKKPIGFHVTFDIELFMPKNTSSWSFGLRYGVVSYEPSRFALSGYTLPVYALSKEFTDLKGDTLDLIIAYKF